MLAVYTSVIGIALVSSAAAQSRTTQSPVPPAAAAVVQPRVSAAPQPAAPQQLRSTYLLGTDDQVTVHALDAEELSDKPVRIDPNGDIRLPLAGRIHAAGLTVGQLEAEVTDRLKRYIKEPEVSVSVVEFRSQPVSVIGSVKNPGVQQLQGRKTLVEMLSLAGGVGEDAGYSVKITRKLEWGPVPLPTAKDDPTGRFSIAEVSLAAIEDARNPAENITICPEDVISVPHAEMVYVIGTVPRAGGYVLHEKQTLSVLQALSLAGGLDHFAKSEEARILRPVAGNGNRTEIPVNLKAIMAGQSGDVPLKPEDILFVPSSTQKKAWARAAEVALQMSTMAVYRF